MGHPDWHKDTITHKTSQSHTHTMGHLTKDGTAWQAAVRQKMWHKKMGHLDRLLPKDGTSWLAQGPNYTQHSQSLTHTMGHLTKDGTAWQAAVRQKMWHKKMGHLDRLLPKDGTSWLAQGPNYTQHSQSLTHTMGHLTKDGTAWQAAVRQRMWHSDIAQRSNKEKKMPSQQVMDILWWTANKLLVLSLYF